MLNLALQALEDGALEIDGAANTLELLGRQALELLVVRRVGDCHVLQTGARGDSSKARHIDELKGKDPLTAGHPEARISYKKYLVERGD